MRALLRKELATTYLDPEVHYDLQLIASAERKPMREILEASIQKYIDASPSKPVVDAAKEQVTAPSV